MLANLLSLPPRELDARLAEQIGVQPESIWTIEGDPRKFTEPRWAWMAHGCKPRGTPDPIEHKTYPAYSDPRSPRSLLDGVEAEIERRGLSSKYVCGLVHLLASSSVAKMDELYAIATAPAHIRAAAAVWAMEGKG